MLVWCGSCVYCFDCTRFRHARPDSFPSAGGHSDADSGLRGAREEGTPGDTPPPRRQSRLGDAAPKVDWRAFCEWGQNGDNVGHAKLRWYNAAATSSFRHLIS